MLNRSTFGGYITEDGRFAFLGGRKARCQSPETILKVGISTACLRIPLCSRRVPGEEGIKKEKLHQHY